MSPPFHYGCAEQQGNHQEVLEDIYSLRYQVYINEAAFEAAVDHPVGLESDAYDAQAIHFYARCRNEAKIIGTVRIILDSGLGFPIERHFDVTIPDRGLEKHRVGEISRLAVSKNYRRRAIDHALFETGPFVPNTLPRYLDDDRARRHYEHNLVRGLYLQIYRDSKQRGLTHWFAVMAKGLHAILRRWGIVFEQIGPAREYHGLRAPYLACIAAIELNLARENPQLLDEARAGLLQ